MTSVFSQFLRSPPIIYIWFLNVCVQCSLFNCFISFPSCNKFISLCWFLRHFLVSFDLIDFGSDDRKWEKNWLSFLSWQFRIVCHQQVIMYHFVSKTNAPTSKLIRKKERKKRKNISRNWFEQCQTNDTIGTHETPCISYTYTQTIKSFAVQILKLIIRFLIAFFLLLFSVPFFIFVYR